MNNKKSKSMLYKERKKVIVKLLKEKKYDEIFNSYGQNIYCLYVPKKYRKKEIKELLKQGRFEDIYRRYGAKIYNKYVHIMKQYEIMYETGNKPKSIFERIKEKVLYRVFPYTFATSLLLPTASQAVTETIRFRDYIIHYREINEYNKKIEEYAKNINGMNLTDTQLFVKLIYDLWKQIKGYAEPKEEILGYLRLSLDKEGIGVCRNFADDLTAKLNLINPNYNARNVAVYMEDANYELVEIERKILEIHDHGEETFFQRVENNIQNGMSHIFGNHEVVAVDILDKNITLILDPTNPSIGVLINGKIHMFSVLDGNGFKVKVAGQLLSNDIEGNLKMLKSEINSFLPNEYTLEELQKEYGIDALNRALEYIKRLERKNLSFDETIRTTPNNRHYDNRNLRKRE